MTGFGGCGDASVMHYDRGYYGRKAPDQAWNITRGNGVVPPHDMAAEWSWLQRMASLGIIHALGGWRFAC